MVELERVKAPVKVCQECGKCCNEYTVGVHLGDLLQPLMKAHYGRKLDKLHFRVKHRCPHLGKTGLCDLFRADARNDKRPMICQTYMCEKAENPELLVLDVEARNGKD